MVVLPLAARPSPLALNMELRGRPTMGYVGDAKERDVRGLSPG